MDYFVYVLLKEADEKVHIATPGQRDRTLCEKEAALDPVDGPATCNLCKLNTHGFQARVDRAPKG